VFFPQWQVVLPEKWNLHPLGRKKELDRKKVHTRAEAIMHRSTAKKQAKSKLFTESTGFSTALCQQNNGGKVSLFVKTCRSCPTVLFNPLW
jgi:hypothetical protein